MEVLMGSNPAVTTDRIRNVVLLGHGGSGKTTLIDACCHAAGSSRRHGNTTEGTALTMFTPEEIAQERQLPTMIFVTMMDRQNADFEKVYQDVKAHLTSKVIPVEIPIGSG